MNKVKVEIEDWDQNDCDFAFIVDEANAEEVQRLGKIGLEAWYAAAHDDVEDKILKYFSLEDIDNFYWAGYAEPAMELLDRAGIEYELVEKEEENDD